HALVLQCFVLPFVLHARSLVRHHSLLIPSVDEEPHASGSGTGPGIGSGFGVGGPGLGWGSGLGSGTRISSPPASLLPRLRSRERRKQLAPRRDAPSASYVPHYP